MGLLTNAGPQPWHPGCRIKKICFTFCDFFSNPCFKRVPLLNSIYKYIKIYKAENLASSLCDSITDVTLVSEDDSDDTDIA